MIVDDLGAAAETEVKTSMTAFRRVINEHERSTLLQISAKRTQEKKELNDYKGVLERHLQEYDLQKAKLATLITDRTKLMQAKADFEVHVKRINQTLEVTQIPRRQYHHIQGIDQLEILKKQLVQCVHYVRCSDPEVERRMVDSQGENELKLDGMYLNPSDMRMVLDAVRSDKVSNSDLYFTFATYQRGVFWTS